MYYDFCIGNGLVETDLYMIRYFLCFRGCVLEGIMGGDCCITRGCRGRPPLLHHQRPGRLLRSDQRSLVFSTPFPDLVFFKWMTVIFFTAIRVCHYGTVEPIRLARCYQKLHSTGDRGCFDPWLKDRDGFWNYDSERSFQKLQTGGILFNEVKNFT